MEGKTKAIFVRENLTYRGQKMGNLCRQLTTGTEDARQGIRLELKAKARLQKEFGSCRILSWF